VTSEAQPGGGLGSRDESAQAPDECAVTSGGGDGEVEARDVVGAGAGSGAGSGAVDAGPVTEAEADPEAEPAAAALVFGDRLEAARTYVAALATDGIVRGLIGPREAGRLWSRHVLNSAVVADLIEPGARVVDIGSGAGLPGIPLAIARPDCRVDLVEPLDRRAQFLREVVELLQLEHCRVVRGRAEDVVADCGGAQFVISRALAPLHRVAVWSAPLIAAGGWMLALKGQSAAEELARDKQALATAGLIDAEVMTVGAALVDPPTLVVRARRSAEMATSPRSGQSRRRRKPEKESRGQESRRQESRGQESRGQESRGQESR
jgi:16S rRNA (guanine527-N7)-methyltransferase